MCSTRVLVTICVCLLAVLIFTVYTCQAFALLKRVDALAIRRVDKWPWTWRELVEASGVQLIAMLSLETLVYAAEETTSARAIVPSTLRALSRVDAAALALGALAFWPFAMRVPSALSPSSSPSSSSSSSLSPPLTHERALLLPTVFERDAAHFAARYLLSVGSVCGIFGALLISPMLQSRILATLAADRLVPGGNSGSNCAGGAMALDAKNGKAGAPRCATLIAAIASAYFASIASSERMRRLVTLNIALRLFGQVGWWSAAGVDA